MSNITFRSLYSALSRVRIDTDIIILITSGVNFLSLDYIKHLVLPENYKHCLKVTTIKQINWREIEHIIDK